MLKLETGIEGTKTYYGDVERLFRSFGYTLCGNWEYDKGKFDAVLWRESGETIYVRIPFTVLDGDLDHQKAFIQFGTPYVIKHVVNIGLDWDENSLITATGLSQFQEPLDKDGYIRDKTRWEEAGEQSVQEVFNSIIAKGYAR